MTAASESFLESLRIASPCKADWSKMVGDDKARFCGICEKYVYDMRLMTRAEAEELVRSKGEACVRMARREDGTVVTSDCPVGARTQERKKRIAAVVGGGLIAASALLWKMRADASTPHTRSHYSQDDDGRADDVKTSRTATVIPATATPTTTTQPTAIPTVTVDHPVMMGAIAAPPTTATASSTPVKTK